MAATADGVLDRLSPDGRRSARALFLRLVSLSDAGAPISHRVRRADLVHGHPHDEVVDALLAGRLLTADAESVEVAHEALGRAWPRLRTWLDEDREGQRILRHLATTSAEWERSGRDDAELYRGGRLRTAEEWIAAATPDLTASEQAFLDQSVARRRAEEEDLAGQAARQRRANRRLRLLLAGVGVLLVRRAHQRRALPGPAEPGRGDGPRRDRAPAGQRVEPRPRAGPPARHPPGPRSGGGHQIGRGAGAAGGAERAAAGDPSLTGRAPSRRRSAVSSTPAPTGRLRRERLHRSDVGHRLGCSDRREAVDTAGSGSACLATSPSARMDGSSPSATSYREPAAGSRPSSSGMPRPARRCPGCRAPAAVVYGPDLQPRRTAAGLVERTDRHARPDRRLGRGVGDGAVLLRAGRRHRSGRVPRRPTVARGRRAGRADRGLLAGRTATSSTCFRHPASRAPMGSRSMPTGQLVALVVPGFAGDAAVGPSDPAAALVDRRRGGTTGLEPERATVSPSPAATRAPSGSSTPATGDELMVLRGHESGSWDVAFTAGGDRLVSGAAAGGLRGLGRHRRRRAGAPRRGTRVGLPVRGPVLARRLRDGRLHHGRVPWSASPAQPVRCWAP